MGYDTNIIVVQVCTPMPEYIIDKDKPYDDGSGYEYKKDDQGNWIKTGRDELPVIEIASLDLCKLGDSALSKVHRAALAKAKAHQTEKFYYRYGSNGNTRIVDDPYGDPLSVAPIDDCIAALQEDCADEEKSYRRNKWALALLTAIKADDENEIFSVMFYGD